MDSPPTALPEASNGLSVTAFFDAQLFDGPDLDRLLERAAVFARAAVGRISEDGRGIARDERGSLIAADLPPSAASATVPGMGGTVWALGIPEHAAPHFLNRLAAAVSIVERWGGFSSRATASPISVLIDRSSSEVAQDETLGRLGIDRAVEIRVVVCSGPASGVERLAELIAREHRVVARGAHKGTTILLLLADGAGALSLPGVPVGVRAGYSRVMSAARTWEAFVNAHDAYRFTSPSPHDLGPYQSIDGVMIDGSRLTGLAALCRLSRDDLDAVPEIGVLDALVEQHGGRMLPVLEAYTISGSLRKAAAQVYMHHNSVAYWVRKAEAQLGYSLSEPNRRAQFFITLCLYRLWKDDDRGLRFVKG